MKHDERPRAKAESWIVCGCLAENLYTILKSYVYTKSHVLLTFACLLAQFYAQITYASIMRFASMWYLKCVYIGTSYCVICTTMCCTAHQIIIPICMYACM